MKKILLTFEGGNFPQETLEFVRCLNTLSPVLLTAAFVPEVDYAHLMSQSGGIAGAAYIPQVADEDEVIERNSALLEEFCREHVIQHVVRTDRLDFALPSIRKEARFADLMALSSRHFFENINDVQPNSYMKEILHSVECPVLLLPEKSDLPGSIILAYDGTPSSIYAIKQFAYLFPELSDIPAHLVFVSGKNDEPFPDATLVEELAGQHFKDLHLVKLNMPPYDFFNDWITGKENPWLVTGSYGRSELSQLFSKSFIAGMIRGHKIPVFIAHT